MCFEDNSLFLLLILAADGDDDDAANYEECDCADQTDTHATFFLSRSLYLLSRGSNYCLLSSRRFRPD